MKWFDLTSIFGRSKKRRTRKTTKKRRYNNKTNKRKLRGG